MDLRRVSMSEYVTVILNSRAYLENPSYKKQNEREFPVLYTCIHNNYENEHYIFTEFTRQHEIQLIGIASEGANWVGGGYMLNDDKIWGTCFEG